MKTPLTRMIYDIFLPFAYRSTEQPSHVVVRTDRPSGEVITMFKLSESKLTSAALFACNYGCCTS